MIMALETVGPGQVKIRSRMVEPDNLNLMMQRIAEGDKSALKSLYNTISPRLFAVLIRMVRGRDVAEDLLQDVFLTIWRKAHQFDPARGDAEVWLFAVTRRKAIDRLRISFRETVGLYDDVANMEPQSEYKSRYSDHESCMSVRKCLKDLKPDVYRALQLCYVFGLTHEELAEEMKVPVGTAKSWIRRGLATLKDSLNAYERK